MNALFRTDASASIGTGHVMRCLALADALRDKGWHCVFVSRAFPGHLGDVLVSAGYQTQLLPMHAGENKAREPRYPHEDWLGVDWASDAHETARAIDDLRFIPDWVIIDHYAIDRRWEEAMRLGGRKLLAIDDLADRAHAPDILVDQNFYLGFEHRYDTLVPPECRTLLGPSYALLRPEFRERRLQMSTRCGPVRRILVFYGGADHTGQTLKALDALGWSEAAGIAVDVVTGASNPVRHRIEQACLTRSNITFHCQVATMATIIGKADLALAAGGTVTWELACLGVPACLTIVADNQRLIVRDLAARGLAVAVGEADVNVETLEASVCALAADEVRRGAMSGGLRSAVDGLGVSRVVDVLLRSAVP